jgi:hypothetical protein
LSENHPTEDDESQDESLNIGVSRPELKVDDLPTPEEAFKVKVIGKREIIFLVLGPSMIALGVSIGSGEWLLGPFTAGKYGFIGIGWVIMVSAILQTFYNVELARFTMATGEVPVVAFNRVPPGIKFWMPFTLIIIFMANIWGGWASAAGQCLFTLFTGRAHAASEIEYVRLLGILLLALSFCLFLFGKKIARTIEIFNTTIVIVTLVSLFIITAIIVPFSYWSSAFASLVTIQPPPKGTDATHLGALAGYTAFASGINFMMINYYREKGYGMGTKVGYISGMIHGKQKKLLASGVTFRDTERNRIQWKRWFRFLLVDQWVVFFIGAIFGMMLPSILVGYLAGQPGAGELGEGNMPIYAATELGNLYGPLIFVFILLIGAIVLIATQTTILEMMIRNTTDSFYSVSPWFRKLINDDPRRFYYPFAVFLIIIISIIIHLAVPTRLILISANMANFAAMIYPLVMIYLNRQLPKPARIKWWGYIVLVFNVVFFGFFFINFLLLEVTGNPLVSW